MDVFGGSRLFGDRALFGNQMFFGGQKIFGSGGDTVVSLPMTTSLPSSVTLIRASTTSCTDCYESVNMVKSGEARFYGARRTENLCPDSENLVTGWSLGANTTQTSVAGITSLRTGRESIKRFVRATTINSMIALASAAYRPGQHTFSIALATGNGTDTVKVRIERSSDSALVGQVDVVPPMWDGTAACMRTYSTFGNITDTSNHRVLVYGTNANDCTLYADGGLMQYTHGRPTGAPDDYIANGVISSPWYGANVDGVRYYDTFNGNTVSSGLVTFAAGAAIPTDTLKGLMVEQGTANGLYSSRDINAGEWTTKVAVTTASAMIDSVPLGVNSLRKMEEDNTTNSHRIGQPWRTTVPPDNTRMGVSCYVKAAERDIVRIGFINKAGTVNLAYFNLTTQTVSNLAGGAEVEAFMYPVGDCFRLFVCGSAGAGGGTIEALYGLAATAGTASYLGVTGSGAYFGGLQFERYFMPTAYKGDTGAATILTTQTDNAYMLSPFPLTKWENGFDFTLFYNSSSINKPNWVYPWYSRESTNVRHGPALRPGLFGGFNDVGANDKVYDLYPNSANWDGVDIDTASQDQGPLVTRRWTIQMHPFAVNNSSSLKAKIDSTTMINALAATQAVNTTPVCTYVRFGQNQELLANNSVQHSFCIKNFYVLRGPTTVI